MDTVQEYLEFYLEKGDQDFLAEYNHPFLLYPEKRSAAEFSTYHTRMADRGGGAKIAGTGKEIKKFRVVAPNAKRSKEFPKKLLIGRGQDRDITIDHSTVSKRHSYFILDEKSASYRLGDAGSTNGTFLNGQPVEAGEPVFVRDGSIVSFGDCDYMFFSPKGFVDLLKRLKNEVDEKDEGKLDED